MIYITGDTHGDFTRFSNKRMQNQGIELTEDDYVIVCGDFDYERRKAIEHDLPFRIVHESWWKEELPDIEEMEEGRRNLAKYDFCVNYVITHCCATEVQNKLKQETGHVLKPDVLTDYLQELEEKLQYKHWYFGHYHMDVNVDDKHTLLYYGMVKPCEEKKTERILILGRPRFHYGDVVSFNWKEVEKVGKIEIIDAHGTFEQSEEPSYDIFVEEDNCLYKHICESEIVKKLSV